jgi:mannose-6-phosphate isomerase-like protein (cupin superfamily)
VSLRADGTSEPLPGGAAFWSLPMQELERVGSTWLVTEHEYSANWPSWEMHPNADEYVYLIDGAASLLLEQGTDILEIDIAGGHAVIIPKGTWHTLKTDVPCRMLFVTMGAGTRNRPAS